jgi:uncharacterized protein GlcG (DUF336 family)
MSKNLLLKPARQLTYTAASIAIDAAVAKSRSIGAPECIAVVDSSGNLLAFARVEGAAVLAREPAVAKAATSVSLGAATGDMPFEFGANLGVASHGGFVNLGGGLPILFEGELVGAIGVGSGSTEQDVAVAQAGRDALLAALASS